MYVTEIFLKNFRNISELRLQLSDGINIFLGRNAQGKTNILESIYFSSVLRSRAAKVQELIQWNTPAAFVKIKFSKADVSQEVAIELTAERNRRRFLVNGDAAKSKNFIGCLNSVMFSPEDLFMLRGAPAGRRQFLDGEISQAAPVYFENLSKYNRIVNQRNSLLKKIRDDGARQSDLTMWNEHLAQYAASVALYRIIAVDRINDFANSIYKNIAAQFENFSIVYHFKNVECDVPLEDFHSATFRKNLLAWYRKNIDERTARDISRGNTGFGPHLDDLRFFINGRELKTYASQGQLRTAALSLKLSELEFLRTARGEYPVLLLDDVMSELDAERRTQLLAFLKWKKIQTIITATEKKYFPAENFGKMFSVIEGTVELKI